MAIVAPFLGLRFNPFKIKSLDEVVSPPYDVINEEVGAELLRKNPYNMVLLDLRNITSGSRPENGSERYLQARHRFESWLADNVLVRDEHPAIYLYFIEYTHPSGRRLTRKGIVALVGLAEFSEGIVKPHEHTFSSVIADRLQLMNSCQAQFSQVFSLYSDPHAMVIKSLETACESEPLCVTMDRDGNTHSVWRVTDPKTLKEVGAFFQEKSLYIADGHHRYTTALGCRANAVARNGGLLAPDNPFNFIMMYLCCIEDRGLSVLPTHRLVSYPGSLDLNALITGLGATMVVEEITGGTRETLVAEVLGRMGLAEMDKGIGLLASFGLYHPGEDRCFLLQLHKDAFKDFSEVMRLPECLRNLDVVILSKILIHEHLGLDGEQCAINNLITYYSDPDEALDRGVKASVGEEGKTQLLFLMNPTKVTQVMEVADAGEVMPHKSTYFYPKVMTGLLLNKLDENEHIVLPV